VVVSVALLTLLTWARYICVNMNKKSKLCCVITRNNAAELGTLLFHLGQIVNGLCMYRSGVAFVSVIAGDENL
jgi:hypothetical protein